MAGNTLDMTAVITCPHGGKVTAVPSNSRVLLSGAPALVQADAMTVAGCTFSPPCVTATWVVGDTRVKVNGVPTVSRGSTANCVAAVGTPQGVQVVATTQTKGSSL